TFQGRTMVKSILIRSLAVSILLTLLIVAIPFLSSDGVSFFGQQAGEQLTSSIASAAPDTASIETMQVSLYCLGVIFLLVLCRTVLANFYENRRSKSLLFLLMVGTYLSLFL